MMSQIKLPLDIESLEILSQRIDNEGNIVFKVKSKNTQSTCHTCGEAATKANGRAPARKVRHLPIFNQPVYLEIVPVRYICENCDDRPTTTEQYDWVSRNATTTKSLEKYLMLSLINSTIQDVSFKTAIGYRVIESILDRQVNQKVDFSKYLSLDTIGIDEIAIKKGHNDYLTIICAKQNNSELTIIAIIEGRDKKKVKDFFESIRKHKNVWGPLLKIKLLLVPLNLYPLLYDEF